MNEYTVMAPYYDTLMTSGYYGYDEMAASLVENIQAGDRVLEIGVGTGLMIEQLRSRGLQCRVTGVDHTPAMLDIARDRVGDWCDLRDLDVTQMDLGENFDVIYSCGGVWLLIDADAGLQMGTHIPDGAADQAAFANVMSHLRPGGLLLLSVQGVHQSYEKALPGGVTYRQNITWHGDLMGKDYSFEGPLGNVKQHCVYRIRRKADKDAFLSGHGLLAVPEASDAKFHAFRKV